MPQSRPPQIQHLKTDSLVPYARNTRTHTDAQVAQIAASIREFGFTNPVLLKKDRTIIAGHGRVLAAQKLELSEVPCLVLDYLTDVQAKALAIADNKIPLNSGWDADLLKLEMDELKDAGVDMALLAFTEGELQTLFNGGQEGIQPSKDDEYEVPDDVTTFIQKGFIIELGRHRLLCGDSTSQENTSELANGQQFDLLLTDPPYNVDYTGKTKDALKVANDSMSDGDFRQFLIDAFECSFSILKPGASFYVWHADSEGYNFRGAVHDVGQKVRQCLIWHKSTLVMGRQDYQWKHEPCLYGWKEGASHGWYSDRKQTTVLNFDKPNRNSEHPTMKPVPLFGYLIGNSTAPQGMVYDPFLGSGTTLIACEQLGRTCYGMELEPKYCQVIIDRFVAYCEKEGRPYTVKVNGEIINERQKTNTTELEAARG